MKELSIEEKAKRYDVVVKKAETLYKAAEPMSGCNVIIETLFPELKESEDEKIRKELIKGISKTRPNTPFLDTNVTREEAIAWLEKQGEIIKEWSEMKMNNIQTELQEMVDLKQKTEQGEQKPVDKVKPKFKVGDFIVNDYCMGRIVEITNDAYLLDTEQGIPFSSYSTHLWDITKDAKDGDVVVDRYGNIGIFEKTFGLDWHSYYYLGCNGDFMYNKVGGSHDLVDTYPATKEQRNKLEKAMSDAGYTFDFEKKELKKIEQEHVVIIPKFKVGDVMRTIQEAADGIKDGLPVVVSIDDEYYRCNNEIIPIVNQEDYEYPPKNRKQSSVWSEEDEKYVHGLIRGLSAKKDIHGHTTFSSDCIDITETINWLESLKYRVQPKQEWSEEDKTVLNNLIYALANDRIGNNRDEYVDWLKSLRPQNRWKPSDEQMEALKGVQEGVFRLGILESLYNDLMKLKG